MIQLLQIPASITIQSGINTPRYASLMGIMSMKKKTIDIVNKIVEILIKACLYGILVLLTSKMFTLNYFEYLDPFAKGFLNVFSNRNKK